MGMTTPAVSQLVHRLEHELGVALFERTQYGLRPTPAGVLLRDRARNLIASETDVLHELETYRGRMIPTLRLYMMDSIAIHLMNAIVPELAKSVRRLEVLSGRSLTHARDFVSGEIDILITGEDYADIPRLERHALCRQELIAVLPATVPTNRRSPAALADSLPLVRFRQSSNLDRDVDAYLRSQNLDLPRTIECGAPATMLEVIAGGHGWAIAPALVVSWFRHRWDSLAWAALPPPSVAQEMHLIAHADRLLSLPEILARRCRAALREEMRTWHGTPAEVGLAATTVYADT
jgi:DNA-binding transcriptional LysR family regulator